MGCVCGGGSDRFAARKPLLQTRPPPLVGAPEPGRSGRPLDRLRPGSTRLSAWSTQARCLATPLSPGRGEPCGGRGQTRPRLPSACESARCVIMLVLREAGGRDRMSGPPARTLKRTPQCRGWGGGVGTELGHVGGRFVGISAPWEEAEGAHSRLCGLPGRHTAGTVVCNREGPSPNTGRPAPCDLEPPVSGLRGCGAEPPWALCHTPGPPRASPGRRSRPPPAPAARRAPPLRFFPDVGTASASTTV